MAGNSARRAVVFGIEVVPPDYSATRPEIEAVDHRCPPFWHVRWEHSHATRLTSGRQRLFREGHPLLRGTVFLLTLLPLNPRDDRLANREPAQARGIIPNAAQVTDPLSRVLSVIRSPASGRKEKRRSRNRKVNCGN